MPNSPVPDNSAQLLIYDLPDQIDTTTTIETLHKVNVPAHTDPTATASIQQAVSLELSFEITQIYFKLKEETVKYFDYISFKISSFGTFLQVKAYDINANIYLNYVECEYGLLNDINGRKLYLISSREETTTTDKKPAKRQRQQRLVDIEITQTTAQSPTLALLHKNILTRIDVRMSSVDFVLNVVALRNVIKFFETFAGQLESTDTNRMSASNKREEKLKPSVAAETHLKEDQISGLIKKAKNSCKKSRNVLTTDLVELKLSASMAGVKARLCTTQADYFQFNVNNLDVDVTNRLAETNVGIVLSSISLLDLQEKATYRHVVSLKEDTDNLINVQLTVFKSGSGSGSQLADKCLSEKVYFRNYLDEEYFDLVVAASISKLRLMFLFKHLDTLLVS